MTTLAMMKLRATRSRRSISAASMRTPFNGFACLAGGPSSLRAANIKTLLHEGQALYSGSDSASMVPMQEAALQAIASPRRREVLRLGGDGERSAAGIPAHL